MDFNPAFHESLPEVGEPPKKVCAACQAPADKSCGACHGVDYCSVEHQKAHWKVHKKDCSPIRIATSPELGRHFVATRDLPPWTLLLTELPVLVNPLIKDCPHSCISCYSVLSSTPRKCPRCSTPFFCNQSCSMNKIHSEFECGILSKCKKKQRAKLCSTEKLGYLRAIQLKNNDPETWAKVLEMPGADKYKLEDEDENDKWFVREILPLLDEYGAGFEMDMIKLKGICQRQILMALYTVGEDHRANELLYLRASGFPHACFPNCRPIIGKGPQLKMQVRNTIKVKKGQILSIDFGVVSYCLGAMAQKDLKENLCICPRCRDPTELGTMLSAIKCTQSDCQDGYLLPVDVEDMTRNAPWRCNQAGCKGEGSTWEGNMIIVSKCMRDIEFFRENVPLADVKRTRKFWESLKKSLHPNHYIVRTYERDLAKDLNQMIEGGMKFSLPRMNLHITMIEHLLALEEMINPGINLTRAPILSQLFDGLYFKVLTYRDNLSEVEQKELLERAIEIIDKFLPIAKCYPDNWNPTEIQEQMEKRIELQVILNSI